MDQFSPVLQRFINQRPVSVMARLAIERMLDATLLNELFETHAEQQYTRELTFAHVVALMNDVVLGVDASVHASYQRRAEQITVSAAALYQKINGIEPGVCQALLRHSYQQAAAVTACYQAPAPLLEGYRVKIVDGNHFSRTQHRLKELRSESAAALPAQALVVLDAETRSICDVYAIEDAHAQERTQIRQIVASVAAADLWIADRQFATLAMMQGVAERQACFLIREHGALKPEAVTERMFVAETASGRVYEQIVRLGKQGEPMLVRRITVELVTPTQDGDTEIHLLSNLPTTAASAEVVAQLYLKRWSIEEAFFELTTTLCCEIASLAYPRAALLTFILALVSYNIVSLVKAAMRAAHGAESVDQEVSAYYLTAEIRQSFDGLSVAVEPEHWQELAALSVEAFAALLSEIAATMRLARYRKHKRGPKKKPPKKKPYVNGAHISTAAIIAKRSAP